jgi:amino acid adenylation domain-containing protein/non-ribosomal peptide synthase protein (TIGR01720 family)
MDDAAHALTPSQRAKLIVELSSKSDDKREAATIPRREQGSAPLPLSLGQQRVWTSHRLDPSGATYNVASGVRLRGVVDAQMLRDSIAELVKRHEILRTTFVTAGDAPIQRIADENECTFEFSCAELPSARGTDGTPKTQDDALRRLVTEYASKPFDLETGPLLRVYLIHLAGHECALLIVMHHIICDAPSFDIFFQELSHVYEQFRSGKSSGLPLLPIQYADYAIWDRSQRENGARAAHLAYWKEYLADAPEGHSLTDFLPNSSGNQKAATIAFRVPEEVRRELTKLSADLSTTLFTALFAGFRILLHRLTSGEDMIVGIPISTRIRPELAGLIGYFVNVLPLRMKIRGDPTVRQTLMATSECLREAYEHRDVPFEELVQGLRIAPNDGASPLCQITFALHHAPMHSWKEDAATTEPLVVKQEVATFGLCVIMEATRSYIDGAIEFNTSLYKPQTVHRLVEHFRRVLSLLPREVDTRISQLPLLAESERNKLLTWSSHPAERLPESSLSTLFEEQVELRVNEVAVISPEEQVTYAELNGKANRLARYLRRRGVGPEVRVAVCMRSTVGAIGVFWGIIKSGGVYVPIDQSYPDDRINYILQDAGALWVIADKDVLPRLQVDRSRVIEWSAAQADIERERPENLALAVDPENLAYMIYTSGTTGRPKAVGITHGTIARMGRVQREALNFWAETVLQYSSLGFDMSIVEFLMAFTSGSRLVLAPRDPILLGTALGEFVRTQGVTAMCLCPTALGTMSGEKLPKLKTLIVGGEACSPDLVREWSEGRAMINIYGATEATLYTTMSSPLGGEDNNIGRPLPYGEVYVLDRAMQLVPVGCLGELCIGGMYLARGYVDRPDLTAERFVPDPCSGRPGSRLYRTGDVGRWREDGVLVFEGRLDKQVKLRGYRIELDEIEAVLKEQEEIAKAVVVLREDTLGDRRLVAYLVPTKGSNPIGVSELRKRLETKLPKFMVPSAYVYLAELPMTPNGKLDQRRLPAPEAPRPDLAESFVAPRTPVEAQLAEIWGELLHVEAVGINDNFFELGGDSILAIQAVARANKVGLKLTPRQLFQQQTVSKLAAMVNTGATPEADQGLVRGNVPLTAIQKWFFSQKPAEPHYWNQEVLLNVRDHLSRDLLQAALDELIRHHDALRTCFREGPSGWEQVVPESVAAGSLLWVDCSGQTEVELRKALEEVGTELHRSFKLDGGELLKAAYFYRGGDDNDRLLLVAHHLIVDGVSWRILVEDLDSACHDLRNGRAVQLPTKTTSYKRWAEGLVDYAKSLLVLSDVEYWLAPRHQQTVDFPVDSLEGTDVEATSKMLSIRLSKDATQSLLHELPTRYHTEISDALLTGLLCGYCRWAGRDRLLVELEGHGREQILPEEEVDVTRTVGWFTSVFPVLLVRGEQESLGETLRSVKAQLRQVPKHGIGYGLLRYLSDREDVRQRMAQLPKAEISVNYLGQLDTGIKDESLFTIAQGYCGPARSSQEKRLHLIEVEGHVIDQCLELDFSYSQNRYRSETVQRFADLVLEALLALCDDIRRARSGVSAVYVPPRDPTEAQVVDIWESVLGSSPIGVTDHFFFDLGGNSLSALSVANSLEELFGATFSPATIFQYPTVEAMAQNLGRGLGTSAPPPLVVLQKTGARTPLFCVHPAPGSAMCYIELSRELGKEQPFYGLEARGLRGAEEPLESIEAMAAAYVTAVRQVVPRGPFFLAGHSFGALVAFEMAQQITRLGEPIPLLALLDAPAPLFTSNAHSADSPTEVELIYALGGIIERFTGRSLGLDRELLLRLGSGERLSQLVDRLRRNKFLSPGTGEEYVRGLLRVLKSAYSAIKRYAPKTVLPVPTTLFRIGVNNPADYPEEFAECLQMSAYGWEALMPSSVKTVTVPGDHITMLNRPHVSTLARELSTALRQAVQSF